MNDILRVFHHPALRDEHLEIHRNMFNTTKKWVEEQPDRNSLNHILGSSSVKAGHNHSGDGHKGVHDHGSLGGHGKTSGSIWTEIKTRDISAMEGDDIKPHTSYLVSPQPGSPAFPAQHQDFGYQNRPGSDYRPNPQNTPYGEHHGHPSHSTYHQQQDNFNVGQEPPSFGMPPGPPQFQQTPAPYPPYPNEQPPYGGGYGGYQGPPGGFQQGGYQQGGYQQEPPHGQPGYPGGPQGPPGYPGGNYGNRY